jgi:hypothetical protein
MGILSRRPESALYPSSGGVHLFSKFKAQSGGPGRDQTHPCQRVHCDSVVKKHTANCTGARTPLSYVNGNLSLTMYEPFTQVCPP